MIKYDSILNDQPSQAAYNKNAQQLKIAAQFSRAAKSYDLFSTIQKLAADQLYALLPEKLNNHSIVIDMGCGTGLHTKNLALHFNNCDVLGLDFAHGMLNYAHKNNSAIYENDTPQTKPQWCAGNMEMLPLKPNHCELIFSNLSLQWCHCINTALKESALALNTSGKLVFSVLIPGSLEELSLAWKKVDRHLHVNQQLPMETYLSSLRENKFKIHHVFTKKHTIYYSNFQCITESLKKTGTNTLLSCRRSGLLSLKKYNQLKAAYENYRQPKGLPLTYNLLYVYATKN